MGRRWTRQIWLGITACLLGLLISTLSLPGQAYQQQKSNGLTLVFHPPSEERVIANRRTLVWIHIKRRNAQSVSLPNCQDCQFSLLAPDGQLLNQFDGTELSVVNTPNYPGAIGTTMIFGAAGKFKVRFEGTINGQLVQLLFPVIVRQS